MTIRLHIILECPPAGFDFGLQKGSGSKFDAVQVQRSSTKDLDFILAITLKSDKRNNDDPDFGGSFVQGPRLGRFIYSDIGGLAGQQGVPQWRLKIPLSGINWDSVEKIRADGQLLLRCRVPGTGKGGGPNCATVKPFSGWELKRQQMKKNNLKPLTAYEKYNEIAGIRSDFYPDGFRRYTGVYRFADAKCG